MAKVPNKSQYRMVNIAELNVDPEAQRPVSLPWVKTRLNQFDADQLGYILVNKRTGGKHFIVDGQHRVELLRAIGWGDQQVHAEVFDDVVDGFEAAGRDAVFLEEDRLIDHFHLTL